MNRRERLKERHWQRWGLWTMILFFHLMILPLTDAADIPTDFPIDIPFDSQTDIPLDSQIDIPLDSQTDIPLDSQIDIPGDIEIDDPFDPSDPYTDIPLEPNIGGSFELRTGVNPDASDLDPETITPENFSEFFGYTAPPEPALTLDGRNAAAIGALWTGQIPGDEIDLYRGIQIVIDTNGDQTFSPLNWNDPSHPWNRPDSGTPYDFTDDPLSWEYTYPPDYPDGSLRNTTIRLSWDESCWCAPEFPTESFDWAWYFDHNGYDTTEIHWLGPEEAGITVWEGRDTFWNLLPNGDYRVQVTLDADGDARFRENEPTAEMLIRIETAIFRGRVVDGAGEPVPGAQISAYSASVWTTAQTDAEGKFILTGLISGEEYSVEVSAKGKVTAEIGPISLLGGEMEKDLGSIPLKEAVAITGTLIILGDTTDLPTEDYITEYDPKTGEPVPATEISLWVEAWNIEDPGRWSGMEITAPRGVDQKVEYILGGLESGRFEIYAELSLAETARIGYELADEQGNSPVFLNLVGSVQKDLFLKPFEGIVTGKVTGEGVDLDYSKVMVSARRPWDWMPPKIATVEKGNLDPQTGEYRISGLGTDEYLIEAGMYLQLPEEGEEVPMMAAPGVGDVMERALVENDASRPTILDFTLTRGYSVSGRIILSADDPPIYEGAPATIEKDLARQPVRAVPMDQYFMGDGLAGVKSPLVAQITANPDGTGAYRIEGLSPGVYLLVPPMISLREGSEQNLPVDIDFSEMEIRRNWSADPIRVVITDDDSRGQDFVLKNGHSVQGTLILPEAQTLSGQYDQWRWTGYLEFQTPENQLLSHAKVFFKGDFNNSDRTGFIFDHVPDGKYILFFWSDQYVSASRQIEILGKDAAVSLEIEPGANIVGKLVDADTGAPVTAKDGIRVICIADPYVEGGYRETIDTYEDYFPDDGVLEPVKDFIPEPGSTIESGDALKEGGGQGSAGEKRPQPGRFHLQAIPAGHKYLLIVEAEHGIKTKGAKNYVGQVISGIEVAQGITGDVDVGTIRLRQGITITGRLTDGDGNPVPNVDVSAFPSDAHEGAAEARGVSDREGYYTIFGIDPDVAYYDLIAAQRPWLFEDWGKQVEWGEERRYNIRPDRFDEATGLTHNAEITLTKATASLSGTITIPEKNEFMIPFLSDDGQSYPSAYILLQRKGVVYKDMLEGIEGLTMPRPPEARTAPYRIDHIQPGTYRITFMNYGLPRAVIDNIAIRDNEQKVIDAAWDDTFYKVSGDLALLSGGYPTTSDISGVLCMNMADQSVVFGRLTKEADNTYSSYEVAGLSGSDRFRLIFYRESGIDNAPRVFSVGEPFSTGGQDIEMDATLTRDLEPTFILRAIQDESDRNRIRIAIFSSEYLTDNRFEIAETEPGNDPETGMLYLKTGGGELKDLEYGEDKRSIFATYEKVSTDKTVEILIAGHYRSDNPISDNPGSDEAVKRAVLSFDASASLINSRMVDRFTANRVSMGHGDDTRLFFPAGAMETQQSDNLVITLEKRGRDSSVSLPAGVTQISDPYAVGAGETGTGEAPSLAEPVTVLLEYDPALVSDIDLVHLYYQTDGGWRRADAESRMIDTKNRTISGEVKGLSAFVAGYGKEIVPEPPAPEPQETPRADIGGGESSDCFIGSLR